MRGGRVAIRAGGDLAEAPEVWKRKGFGTPKLMLISRQKKCRHFGKSAGMKGVTKTQETVLRERSLIATSAKAPIPNSAKEEGSGTTRT